MDSVKNERITMLLRQLIPLLQQILAELGKLGMHSFASL